MRTKTMLFTVVAIASGAVGATAQVNESVELPPELDRVLRDYEQAWGAGDEDRLATLFVSDGLVVTRDQWVRGQEEELLKDGADETRCGSLTLVIWRRGMLRIAQQQQEEQRVITLIIYLISCNWAPEPYLTEEVSVMII